MRAFLSLILALGVILPGLPAAADDGDSARLITVTGEGEVEAVPDMAQLSLGVTHHAPDAADAMANVSAAVTRILARLEEEGIAARDIQTRSVSVRPVWSNDNRGDGPRQITGFVAANTVSVAVRDLDLLGGLLNAVIADGANNFNGLRFTLSDPRPAADAARRAAVADAAAKAALLAEAAGVTLGPVQSIEEQGGRVRPVMMEAARSSDAVPVAPGTLTLRAQVRAVYAIAD